jgi:hypothetical protein
MGRPGPDGIFRRRLSDGEFQQSEANLAEFVKARGNTKPHLACLAATEALSAVNENKSSAARDTAKTFLKDILSSGPIAAADIEEAAGANGIAKRTSSE